MRYRRSGDTAWRVIAGESIVVDLKTQLIFGLNGSAAVIWENVDGRTAEEVHSLMPSVSPASVASFLEELVDLGILHLVEGPVEVTTSGEKAEVAAVIEAPSIVWREEVRQAGASCAFQASQNPLCSQIPST